MSGVGGLLELYWNFIGVDRNFIGTVSLRYCYVIATLLLRYCYVIGTLLLRYWYVIATLLVRYRYVIGRRSGLDRGCPIYGASPSAHENSLYFDFDFIQWKPTDTWPRATGAVGHSLFNSRR